MGKPDSTALPAHVNAHVAKLVGVIDGHVIAKAVPEPILGAQGIVAASESAANTIADTRTSTRSLT